MFFLRARFSLLEKYVIEFNDAATKESDKLKAAEMQAPGARKAGSKDALVRLLRDNVAQVGTAPCG